MATIRVEKKQDYTVLANAAFDDPQLSLKAVGLLGYMLRQPDDWNFTLEWLAGKHKDGLASIRSAMEELEAAGYVSRGQSRESGRFAHNEYVVREIPEADTSSGAPRHLPLEGKAQEDGGPPSCDFRTTAPPSCDFPITENPITENRTLPSTNKANTNIPPYSPPQGDDTSSAAPGAAPSPQGEGSKKRRRRGKLQCEYEPAMFERFWTLYPRGEDKTGARYEWDKLKPDLKLMLLMSSALKRQLLSKDWQKGIGIPYACRWLRDRRWEWVADMDEKSSAGVSNPDTQREEAIPWI